MRRRLRSAAALLAAAAALAALVAGCGGADSASAPEGAEKVDLILDWFPNADHAGVSSGSP